MLDFLFFLFLSVIKLSVINRLYWLLKYLYTQHEGRNKLFEEHTKAYCLTNPYICVFIFIYRQREYIWALRECVFMDELVYNKIVLHNTTCTTRVIYPYVYKAYMPYRIQQLYTQSDSSTHNPQFSTALKPKLFLYYPPLLSNDCLQKALCV